MIEEQTPQVTNEDDGLHVRGTAETVVGTFANAADKDSMYQAGVITGALAALKILGYERVEIAADALDDVDQREIEVVISEQGLRVFMPSDDGEKTS